MSILCTISSLLQFVILVALTGFLVSVAAVSRLMEVIVSFVYPITILMLHQSGRLIIDHRVCLSFFNYSFIYLLLSFMTDCVKSSRLFSPAPMIQMIQLHKMNVCNHEHYFHFIICKADILEQLEVFLTDLNTKFPSLQYVLRPQYTPYLNTAGTVLLGWLIVSWVSYVVWSLLAPLAITIIAIILICPTTAKWCVSQTVPAFELSFSEYLDKCQAFLSQIYA